jgi:hypothetical protein
MLNATFYVGITKLQALFEISKSAAILYALNDGLFLNGSISEEDHDVLAKRYSRKLKEVIAEGKENSHISKLELEKQKRVQCQSSAQKETEKNRLANVAFILKGCWEQWDSHTGLEWRLKTVAYAKKYPDMDYAKRLIAKEKDCDIISQQTIVEPSNSSGAPQ